MIVDRELGRTKKSWLPRRFGGGKGGESRRSEKADALVRDVERELRHEAREQEVKSSKPEAEERREHADEEREPGEL